MRAIRVLLSTVALSAASVAAAQAPAPAGAPQAEPGSPGAPGTPLPPTDNAAASARVDTSSAASPADIVVTGLKRDEALIKVPVAVSVFNERAIERAGITRPEDFLALTSNVAFEKSNHAGEFFVDIRGQTSVRQSEGAVAIVIDGVPLATQNEFNGELFDIQQIEVLKGPQGAIYGRNASAGAIVITTKSPTDTLEGEVKAGYGNWNSAKGSASIGGAIVPGKLRFRVSASINDTDGPYTNINTGEKVMRQDEKLGRVRLIYEPDSSTTFDLRGTGSHLTGGAIAFNSQVVGAVQGGVLTNQISANDTSLPYTSDVQGKNVQDKWNVALKADHTMSFATLTSITSYSRIIDNYQAKNYPYGSYVYAGNNFNSAAFGGINVLAAFGDNTQKFRIDNRAFIQELRLTSPSDQRFRWQLGMYFLDSHKDFYTEQGIDGRLPRSGSGALIAPFVASGTTMASVVPPITRTLIGGGVILPTLGIDGPDSSNGTLNYDHNRYGARNFAPFANIQLDITERFEVDIAGRYDIEHRTIRTETPNIPNPFFGVAPGAPAATYNLCVAYTGLAPQNCYRSRTFRGFEPKVTASYKFPGNTGSLYASYGRSFKSGGFNPIGTRAVLLQGLPNILVQDSYNKEVADSFEVGVKSVLFNRRLNLNAAVFHTTVQNAQQFEFFPTGGIQAISQIKKTRINGVEADFNARLSDSLSVYGGGGYLWDKIVDIDSQDPADRASIIGNRIPFVPRFNMNFGAQLTQPISSSLNLLARADFIRTGRTWYDQRNQPNTDRNPFNLVNARLGFGNDRWELAMWSKNLLNKHYNSDEVVILPIANAVYRAPSRSFGVEGQFKF